jgi:hypothetical protein
MIWRGLVIVAGLGVVAAATHANVLRAGGYLSEAAPLTITVAAMLAVGMGYVGIVINEGRRLMAIALLWLQSASRAQPSPVRPRTHRRKRRARAPAMRWRCIIARPGIVRDQPLPHLLKRILERDGELDRRDVGEATCERKDELPLLLAGAEQAGHFGANAVRAVHGSISSDSR